MPKDIINTEGFHNCPVCGAEAAVYLRIHLTSELCLYNLSNGNLKMRLECLQCEYELCKCNTYTIPERLSREALQLEAENLLGILKKEWNPNEELKS